MSRDLFACIPQVVTESKGRKNGGRNAKKSKSGRLHIWRAIIFQWWCWWWFDSASGLSISPTALPSPLVSSTRLPPRRPKGTEEVSSGQPQVQPTATTETLRDAREIDTQCPARCYQTVGSELKSTHDRLPELSGRAEASDWITSHQISTLHLTPCHPAILPPSHAPIPIPPFHFPFSVCLLAP